MRRLRRAKIPAADRFGGGCFSIEEVTLPGASISRISLNVLLGHLKSFHRFEGGRDRRFCRRVMKHLLLRKTADVFEQCSC